jgi:hypothetical protein
MTDSSYYLAWLVYIAACTGTCLTGWQLIKSWIPLPRYSVMTPAMIVLLTPYFSDPSQARLAPAILTSLFEGMFGETKIALKALSAIAVLLVAWFIISFILLAKKNIMTKNISLFGSLTFMFFLLSLSPAYANEKLIAGSINCTAEWNELCEDKKIISVPEKYRLCYHDIVIASQAGDANYQVVASDQKSITVYFRAKGNQDRSKPSAASINLNVALFGVKDTDSCDDLPAPTKPVISVSPASLPSPDIETINTSTAAPETPVDAPTKVHACACSQWLNWMKVEHCLTKEQRADRPPCDSYQVTIQCVTSKDECRAIQKDNCPQIAGLNQSTSYKRLYIENSPYCQP